MRSAIRLGHVAGIRVGVHYSLILTATLLVITLVARFDAARPGWPAALAWSAAAVTALLFLLTLVVHELAHALVARRAGLTVHSMTLFALGGISEADEEVGTAGADLKVAIVGPLTSGALGSICLGAAQLLGWTLAVDPAAPQPLAVAGSIAAWLGCGNVAIACVNLLPAYPLDAGRVLRSVLWRAGGNQGVATRRAVRISLVIAVALVLLGLLQFIAGMGLPALCLWAVGWFLTGAASAGYLQATMPDHFGDVDVSDVMEEDCASVDGCSSLETFVQEVLLRSARPWYVVCRGDQFVGLITPADVQRVSRDAWPTTAVATATPSHAVEAAVSPGTSAAEALRVMTRRDLHQIPVVNDGRLSGVVTRTQILRLLDTRIAFSATGRS